MEQKNQNGFCTEGNWYKGNLHSHTVNSDGRLTPGQAVQLYQEEGYHFLCLSEHNVYTDYREEFNTDSFILLPGIEASAVLLEHQEKQKACKVHHIHGILGTEAMQETCKAQLFRHMEQMKPQIYYGMWDGAEAAQTLANDLRRKGCITTYNHPIWSRVEAEEVIHTEGIFGLEIYNYNTVNESGTGFDTAYWDMMLRKNIRIHGFASDDNHNEGRFEDACGGYVMVKARKLTHDHIIKSLISGSYYSTNGPDIYDWGIRDGVAFVLCSPVERVNFICGNYVNAGGTVICKKKKEFLEYAEYELQGDESYIRIECVDKYGKTAWSNAITF